MVKGVVPVCSLIGTGSHRQGHSVARNDVKAKEGRQGRAGDVTFDSADGVLVSRRNRIWWARVIGRVSEIFDHVLHNLIILRRVVCFSSDLHCCDLSWNLGLELAIIRGKQRHDEGFTCQ